MNVGIVGHEAAKFTKKGQTEALDIIMDLLSPQDAVLVSGGCHLGGIDIWAEQTAMVFGRAKIIHKPKSHDWSNGYKPRNILIARDSDVLHCLAAVRLADSYQGMKFKLCYHCNATDHVKGGGCWTMKYAKALGKTVELHQIANEE